VVQFPVMAEDTRNFWGKVGAAVRAQRTSLGLRQVELAKRAGVDAKTISKMEAGYGPFRDLTLAAVSRVLWGDDQADVLERVADGDRPPRGSRRPDVDPEEAVKRSPEFSEDDKEAIVAVIRQLRRRRQAS
jgi:transcriptional regulator with XRE-family HTH domain